MKPSKRSRLWRTTVQTIVGTLAVGLITAVGYRAQLNSGIPAFLFLLVVVTLSVFGGFLPAAVVSVAAVGCVDYFFIPPVLEWQITDPIDAVGLLTYWATSLVISRLASNAQREAERAEKKRRETALLYDAASRLLSLEPEVAGGTQSLRVFREVFSLRAVCLYDGATSALLTEGEPRHRLAEMTARAYADHQDNSDANDDLSIRCLHVAGTLKGAIGFESGLDVEFPADPLSLLAATTLERAHSFRDSATAAAVAQAEILRSAILDALAHEFKTPLAAIMAAAGGLRINRRLGPDEVELAELIESESSRLGHLTTRLLRIARLDRDEVKPKMEVTDLGSLIKRLAKEYQAHDSERKVTVSAPSEPAEVMSDPELINLAVAQLLDNAVKYSPLTTPVDIELSRNNGAVDVFVTNLGQPIRPQDQEKIFERFYRTSDAIEGVSSGTGLGLYVARKIVLAHCGTLTLDRDHAPPDHVTFRMSLPTIHCEPGNAN
jgi:two-component system sensor histidine kinase KdpD